MEDWENDMKNEMPAGLIPFCAGWRAPSGVRQTLNIMAFNSSDAVIRVVALLADEKQPIGLSVSVKRMYA